MAGRDAPARPRRGAARKALRKRNTDERELVPHRFVDLYASQPYVRCPA
jgi:hypothetical protein